jgi:hypothetical protein
VAHTWNPSCSGGKDQEHCGSKPAWANSSWDPISKQPIIKKDWWSGSSCRPWVWTPVLQKKKETNILNQRDFPEKLWLQTSDLYPALLTITKIWKELKFPLTAECIVELRCTFTYSRILSTLRSEKILQSTAAWMSLNQVSYEFSKMLKFRESKSRMSVAKVRWEAEVGVTN